MTDDKPKKNEPPEGNRPFGPEPKMRILTDAEAARVRAGAKPIVVNGTRIPNTLADSEGRTYEITFDNRIREFENQRLVQDSKIMAQARPARSDLPVGKGLNYCDERAKVVGIDKANKGALLHLADRLYIEEGAECKRIDPRNLRLRPIDTDFGDGQILYFRDEHGDVYAKTNKEGAPAAMRVAMHH